MHAADLMTRDNLWLVLSLIWPFALLGAMVLIAFL
jgi:hypothetical protein